MDVIFDWNLGNMIYNGLVTLRLCGFPFAEIRSLHLQKVIAHQQHHLILTKQDTYHRWRYKKVWATKEDRNTTFFQRSILKRTRRNRIIHLTNLDGSMSTTPQKLEATLNYYFKSIFTSQCSSTTTPSTATNSHDQVSETNNFTHSTPDPQEIHSIVNEMRSTAATGLHELNAGFYKSI